MNRFARLVSSFVAVVSISAFASSPRSPVSASLEERSRSENQVTVVVKVEEHVALNLPITVSIKAPAGVTVVDARDRQLAASTQAGTREVTFTLQWSGAVPADVELSVDQRGGGYGFHATLPYRFGRAAPVVAQIRANGPSFTLPNGLTSGASIPLTK